MPYGTFTYESEKSEVVEPTDVGVVRDVGRERLVLTACHPSTARRRGTWSSPGSTDIELG